MLNFYAYWLCKQRSALRKIQSKNLVTLIDNAFNAHHGDFYSQLPEEELVTIASNIFTSMPNAPYFQEEELIALMGKEGIFKFVPNTDKNLQKLRSLQQSLITTLRDYKVTGYSFAVDPNFAFFIETQNPEFTVQYKDQTGNIKTRNYRAKINTIGLKLELSLKLDLIFFVNTDMNFFDSNKEIKFGNGIDANIAMLFGCGVTYASFADMPGGMLILSLPLFFAGPSLSLVTGGSLIPA
ncbi:hypothetical protein IPF37_01180 [bacterium]|nr:MAG: hypothetical protein IPF37_01180 [bacterium]